MLEIAELTKNKQELIQKVTEVLDNEDIKYDLTFKDSEVIKLVFAGQYSAGKSTILKMLTGREDIQTGADITTQEAQFFDWNGIQVVDTPGIHTGLRPDHDEIAYNEINSADMLVYVITNELFDSNMADHFRKLAIDHKKANQMILVVNKMGRTSDGNTPEQQGIIRKDLEKVLLPYTTEQFYLSFLDAKSYLDGLAEMEDDPEYGKELIEMSGYDAFIDTLNRFVRDKSIPTKLTADLRALSEFIEEQIKKVQPQSGEAELDALEENYLQQRHLLTEAWGRLQNEVKSIYINAVSKISDEGLKAAKLLEEGCSKEEVEKGLQDAINNAELISESCQKETANIIEQKLTEIGEQLESIEDTEYTIKLKAELSGKFEKFPEEIQKILKNSSRLKDASNDILQSAYKPGASGLKLTSFSGSKIHQLVLNIGHKFNYSFSPWQAIKITRGIAAGATALGVLGVAFSVYAQFKSEADDAKISKDLRTNRQNIRSQFNSAASQLKDYGDRFIVDNIDKPFKDFISEIDDNIQTIRNTRENRSRVCINLEELQRECRSLIDAVYNDLQD